MIEKKKLVLAYSGGLDTSFCLVYLNNELNFEVHTILVDTGGFSQNELDEISGKAYLYGAKSHTNIHVENEYYHQFLRFLIFGNILKNGTYPLSVSSERAIQAYKVVEFARNSGAAFIAHGSTGAGNDQVRFDMVSSILAPDIQIITPVRDLRFSRIEELNYLKSQGFEVNFETNEYSINKGLWGTSIGGKETLRSKQALPEKAFPGLLQKNGTELIKLGFRKGELKKINDSEFDRPVVAIRELETMVSPYAIGRDIHVGDTILGTKGRVGFEAAAPLIIIKSHHLLEKHVLSKWQLYWKEQLANWYGMLLHEAQFLEPVIKDIEKFLESSQERVTGDVFVRLFPYRFQTEGIESEFDLMNSEFGDYGEINRYWDGDDVKGFTKIYGLASRIYRQVGLMTEELH